MLAQSYLPLATGFEVELIGGIAATNPLSTIFETAGHKGSAIPDPYRRSVKAAAKGRNHRQRMATRRAV